MRAGWKEVKFGDVVEFPPKIKMSKGVKYPFIPMELIDGGYKYVKPIVNKELAGGGAKFEEGDTLFARITPCLQNGKIAQAKNLNNKPGFGSTEYFIFRGIPNITDNDFVYYLSQMNDFRNNAINSMVGASGRQRADAGHIRSFVFNLPPLETQIKIASILSGYDDLIENNLKRITILEEMAQQTYEEWFVRMRFPGYEIACFDSETGLPEGWEKLKLGDLGEIVTGKTPSTLKEEYFGNDIPFIKTPDINSFPYTTDVSQYLSCEGANSQKNKYVEKNTLIVSCIGSCAGGYALTSIKSQYNQQINGIKFSKEDYVFFTYCFAKGLKSKIEYLGSNGATMTNVSKTKFEQIEITIPSNSLLKEFHHFAKPCFDQILNIQSQNQRLREARDILLPRLMMGLIEV